MELGLFDLALEGGGAATRWSRQHQARKRRKEKAAARKFMADQKRQAIEDARRDLKKRKAKWWARWKQRAAYAKANGLKRPSLSGQPKDNKKRPQWKDMAGRKVGRLTVLRIAPTSRNSKKRQRFWWTVCDCGSGEHLVRGDNLREARTLSCGCLKIEALRAKKGVKRAQPLSVKMLTVAASLRASGNVMVARLLELAAPSVRISERKRQRRKARAA